MQGEADRIYMVYEVARHSGCRGTCHLGISEIHTSTKHASRELRLSRIMNRRALEPRCAQYCSEGNAVRTCQRTPCMWKVERGAVSNAALESGCQYQLQLHAVNTPARSVRQRKIRRFRSWTTGCQTRFPQNGCRVRGCGSGPLQNLPYVT